jgi:uncharacterized protein (DUF302 family)
MRFGFPYPAIHLTSSSKSYGRQIFMYISPQKIAASVEMYNIQPNVIKFVSDL